VTVLDGAVTVAFTDLPATGPAPGAYLVLHGGAGSFPMLGFAAALAASTGARVVVPTYPGFDGEPRPESLKSVADLASAQLALMDALDLKDVTVVGNSMGGWLAAEIALRHSPRVRGVVLLNGVGIAPSEGKTITDMSKIPPPDRVKVSFFDPQKYAPPFNPALAEVFQKNQQALAAYCGPAMHDPTLSSRLAECTCPALMVWGESDGVASVEYGRAFASSFARCRFELVPRAGHFPHVEQQAEVLRLIAGLREESA